MDIMEIYYAEWGNGGRLWGGIQLPCIFDGLVDSFTEIPILFCRPLAADIAAVFVIIGLGYAAMFQELFCPKSAAFARPDGL